MDLTPPKKGKCDHYRGGELVFKMSGDKFAVFFDDAVGRFRHSGSGCPLVSGAKGKTSSPSRKIEHMVSPAYRMGSS